MRVDIEQVSQKTLLQAVYKHRNKYTRLYYEYIIFDFQHDLCRPHLVRLCHRTSWKSLSRGGDPFSHAILCRIHI